MKRHDETKAAVADLLGAFGTEPRSLYDVGVPLVSGGYDQNTIVNALFDLVSDGAIKLLPENSLRVVPGKLRLPVGDQR
ncbi:hypothetical protein ASG42_21295 [Rhizobium sp. Leaf391]|uniref:hypothetical protein n=1 Tax=Rhizobium sp. Leaf391 TaxID=1736360 RepID=UPI0007161240|nr:hypothetical protein [Rhizobium sp. Leaf391]KQT05065.1 hypothetical protein ASG42_21295 [Rhizobium sp. Leaf391]